MKKNELEFELDSILNVLSRMDNKEVILEFLSDLMTENELLENSKRFNVAIMLDKWISYSRISQKTWLSSATIAKISKSLNSSNLWYRNAINILEE